MAELVSRAYAPFLETGTQEKATRPNINLALEGSSSLIKMIFHMSSGSHLQCRQNWSIFTGDTVHDIANFSLHETKKNGLCRVFATFQNHYEPVSVDFEFYRRNRIIAVNDVTAHTIAGSFDLKKILEKDGIVSGGLCIDLLGIFL